MPSWLLSLGATFEWALTIFEQGGHDGIGYVFAADEKHYEAYLER